MALPMHQYLLLCHDSHVAYCSVCLPAVYETLKHETLKHYGG
jgi:hypothetical protein